MFIPRCCLFRLLLSEGSFFGQTEAFVRSFVLLKPFIQCCAALLFFATSPASTLNPLVLLLPVLLAKFTFRSPHLFYVFIAHIYMRFIIFPPLATCYLLCYIFKGFALLFSFLSLFLASGFAGWGTTTQTQGGVCASVYSLF